MLVVNFSFSRFVGWRFFGFRRAVTLLSVGGVTLGTAVLLIVLSVMNGFSSDLKERLLSIVPHVLVESADHAPLEISNHLTHKIRNIDPGILSVAKTVQGECIVRSDSGMTGGIIKGLELSDRQRHPFSKYLIAGELFQDHQERPIILGDQLAAQLKVYIGDFVSLVSPIEKEGPLGSIPFSRSFKVIGIHQMGVVEYDAKYAYLPLEDAQRFFLSGRGISALEISLADSDDASTIADKINRNFGSQLVARPWRELHQHLFAALRLEKIAMFLILSCIILVASFNIVGSLAMSILNRQKAISVLMAMGASRTQISAIFMSEGLFIGLIGTTLGLLSGGAICWVLKNYPIIELPDLYMMRTLPVLMTVGYFISVGMTSLVIVIVATWFPSNAAAKMNPLKGLRYE